jgi:hypothetical protein
MRKGLVKGFLMWGMALLISIPSAFAGEVDLLVQKLVEKGILTPYEAQILKDDIRQDVNKQIAEGKNDALPSWIQSIKLKGDVRLRYQSEQKEASTVHNRGRVRYRLGLEAQPNSRFGVGAGLASGSDNDARSTNETLGDGFAKDGIYLDYAWGEYKPNQMLSMIGGKYNASGKGYLWYTTDMMWDSDINQEGASAHMDLANALGGDAFLNAGYWTLSESSSDASDAGMYYSQAGIAYSIDAGLEEPLKLKLAGTFYSKIYDDANSLLNNGKTTQSAANNKYDYNKVYAGSAELVYNWPEETSFPIKMVGIFGDYVNNPDPSSENTGWAAGIKFGHKKVSDKKDWQFKYQYVSLGSVAWIDVFPDSDRYSGNTNVKSHEFILDIGLAKNISLGLDYYLSDVLKGTSRAEHVFQADVNFKF